MKLSHRFEEALAFAANLHSSQWRKGTNIPYVSHLLAVSGIALEHGANENEAIAALLHDAVEDQGGLPTLEQIRQKFGEEVADIVWGCSDTDTYPKPPWRERKEAYIAHLRYATDSVLLVSACDKLHNARTTLSDLRYNGDEIWQRFRGGKEGLLWYFRTLVESFKGRVSNRLVDELDRVVTELETLAGQVKS
jgi:GTP pyrophosphokinase